MTHAPLIPETPTRPAAAAVFDRILVGIDGTSAGFDACRQAAQLATPESVLAAASVVQIVPLLDETLEHSAKESLAVARQILGPRSRTRRLYGLVVEKLLAEAERMDATLIAIGSHGHRRLEEILLGGAAGELLHRAPCSVLVARPAPDLAMFPHSVVAGVDGSREAELAFGVAELLASRHHGALQGLVAYGDTRVDVDEVLHHHPRVETSEKTAVHALVEASACADLVVVGSRGLRGPRALASVSERVAHEARSSVLVIRKPKAE